MIVSPLRNHASRAHHPAVRTWDVKLRLRGQVMTNMKKTTKRGQDLASDVTTYRAVEDQGGIEPPLWANTRRPKGARYVVSWGDPVGYLRSPFLGGYCEGVAGSPSRLSREDASDRQAAFCAAMEAFFADRGFTRSEPYQNASEAGEALFPGWKHNDHPRYRFRMLRVSSAGMFSVEAECGAQIVRYEFVNHAAAQHLLGAAADDEGMI